MKNKKRIYQIMSIVFILDQIIKLLIVQHIKIYQKITIIPKFFSIFYVRNTGAAFSILEDSTFFLIIISVLFLIFLHEYLKKEIHYTPLSILSLGFLLGGIFGNLLDRIVYHAVVDYLSFTFGSYEFPVFNLADAAITLGIGIFLCDMLLEERKQKK